MARFISAWGASMFGRRARSRVPDLPVGGAVPGQASAFDLSCAILSRSPALLVRALRPCHPGSSRLDGFSSQLPLAVTVAVEIFHRRWRRGCGPLSSEGNLPMLRWLAEQDLDPADRLILSSVPQVIARAWARPAHDRPSGHALESAVPGLRHFAVNPSDLSVGAVVSAMERIAAVRIQGDRRVADLSDLMSCWCPPSADPDVESPEPSASGLSYFSLPVGSPDPWLILWNRFWSDQVDSPVCPWGMAAGMDPGLLLSWVESDLVGCPAEDLPVAAAVRWCRLALCPVTPGFPEGQIMDLEPFLEWNALSLAQGRAFSVPDGIPWDGLSLRSRVAMRLHAAKIRVGMSSIEGGVATGGGGLHSRAALGSGLRDNACGAVRNR